MYYDLKYFKHTIKKYNCGLRPLRLKKGVISVNNSLAIITKILRNVDLARNLYHFPVIER